MVFIVVVVVAIITQEIFTPQLLHNLYSVSDIFLGKDHSIAIISGTYSTRNGIYIYRERLFDHYPTGV